MPSIANVFQKYAVVFRGAYVAAGVPGSLSDVGYTLDGVEISWSQEDNPISPDQEPGVIARFPVQTEMGGKFTMLEATVDNFLWALRLPAANKTGTTPNFTLEIGAAAEQYSQLQVVGKGGGTTGVRTATIWKGMPESNEPISFKKNDPTKVGVSLAFLLDPSVTAAGKFMKLVES